jgi:hypothetical protein
MQENDTQFVHKMTKTTKAANVKRRKWLQEQQMQENYTPFVGKMTEATTK